MELVMKSVFGSQLYGLATPQSDTDYKGIYIPDHADLIMQKAVKSISQSTGSDHSKNTAEDVDLELFSLHEFIRLAAKGETVAIDMLHTPDDMLVVDSPIWMMLRAQRSRFYTTNMVAYIGYVRKQAAKYGVKGSRMEAIADAIKAAEDALGKHLEFHDAEPKDVRIADVIGYLPKNKYLFPTTQEHPKTGDILCFYQVLEKRFQYSLRVTELIDILQKIYDTYGSRAKQAMENEGIDWKAMSHALRAGFQLKEIYETGDLVYPLKEREFLLKVKLGELDFMTEVKPRLEELVAEVEEIANRIEAEGTLPTEVDMEHWENFLYNIYGRHIVTEFERRGV